ncbi:MAG: hypothetical protein C4518_03450 [Desulfobacteraceae bacterium]|nr:MAG: hypothetical protein C4518_03450 [Desulfobacteraceae bacterium]
MEKIKLNAQLLFSLSVFCLALSIGYFAFEIHQFLTGFPAILVQLEKTAREIRPVVDDIADTSRNILPISDNLVQVAEGMPAIIEEVRAIRESLPETLDKTIVLAMEIEKISQVLPDVLEEVRQTRQLIPDVLKTADDLNATIPLVLDEMKQYRKELPKVTQTIDEAAVSVQGFTKEMAAIRPLVPKVLTEVEKTRETIPGILEEVEKTRKAIPDMLDQAERIAAQGEEFGADASKGAVKGTVSGLVNLFNPMALSRQLQDLVLPGRKAQELTTEDLRLIRETAIEIVKNGTRGATMKWKNPESRNEGRISVVREFQDNGVACKEAREEIWHKTEKTHDFKVIFCLQADGSWARRGDPVSN